MGGAAQERLHPALERGGGHDPERSEAEGAEEDAPAHGSAVPLGWFRVHPAIGAPRGSPGQGIPDDVRLR
ncbi:hypothetical protein GCM10010220_56460 [Streptomyces parvulus]|nr:hypothetical protein GCM10010220_56460 [Streptomyces parvulus]